MIELYAETTNKCGNPVVQNSPSCDLSRLGSQISLNLSLGGDRFRGLYWIFSGGAWTGSMSVLVVLPVSYVSD